MPTSSRHGSGTETPINSRAVEDMTSQLQLFFDAVSEAEQNNKRNGMGCFTLVRATGSSPVAASLLDDSDRHKIVSAWDRIRWFKTRKKDTAMQYFHLHGVIFLMVPHVTERDQGQVTITLFSGNNPDDPLDSKTLNLADGPAVVIMTPTMCLPLTYDMAMFYYHVSCTNTSAHIPCSVMAMWKQEINQKVGQYKSENVVTWALEKLAHPQLVKSSQAAAHLISNYYSSGNRESDRNPQPQLGFSRSIRSMDVGAMLNQSNIGPSILQRPQIELQSKRHTGIFVPATTCSRHSCDEDPDEEKSTSSITSAHLQAQSGYNRHDRAYFNVANGFVGRQQESTLLGSELLEYKPWIKEVAEMQRVLDGGVKPFDVEDADYYDIGVVTKWEHFLYLVLEEQVEPNSLIDDYAVEVEKYNRLYEQTPLCQLQDMEEELQDVVLDAIDNVKVVVACWDEKCECTDHSREDAFHTCSKGNLVAQVGSVLVDGATEKLDVNNFQTAVVSNPDMEDVFLDASDSLFNFSHTVSESDYKILEVTQPAIVTSQEFFEVGVFEFEWKASDIMNTQLLEIPLPSAFNSANPMRPAGVRLLEYFDAGILEFEATVNLSASFAVTGEMVLLWDEGDILGSRGENINQASLLTTGYMCVGAAPSSTSKLRFTPIGVGKYVPFDASVSSSKLGSLRLYVLYPIVSAEPTMTFPGHVHLRAKMLSSNIMQAPRSVAQFVGGMPIGEARIPELPCSQIISSTIWPTSSTMGDTLMYTFSPSSVFEQNGVLQPSVVCNLFRNCKWWTGECEFELHFDKSVFHSGSLGIGFGTITSDIARSYDIFNTTHVVANVGDHHTFRFSVSIHSWNGKNLLTTGRKSSLPKVSHQALLRIFITIMKPLITTNPALTSINFHLMLKRIKNLVVGGSTPIKPVFGHWKEGKSGADFIYSESSGPQEELLNEMRKQNLPTTVQPRSMNPLTAQISMRSKLAGSVKQYMVKSIDDEKRYLVIPVAPWSYEFKDKSLVASEVNPLIDICSSFLYWSGSLSYTIIVHRKQASSNVGGIMVVSYESSGYPVELGLHDGKQPPATGGGRHWSLELGANSFIHSFRVEDDRMFQRRYTKYNKFDATKSRLDTLTDRLGNLIIYLPSSKVANQVEIQVSLGPDFQFSHVRVPAAATEKVVGDMESHVYKLDRDSFKPLENSPGVFSPPGS